MTKLLHPTDFSGNSQEAFSIACSIARDKQASLIVLCVVSPRECATEDMCEEGLNPGSKLYRNICRRFDQLKQAADQVPVSFQIKVGETVETILDVARHEQCDLIIVAGRSHTDSYYQLHGRICESLIRRAPCSVLMLRHFHNPSPGDTGEATLSDESSSVEQEVELCGKLGPRW